MILIREAKFILAYWRRALLRSFFFAPFLVYRIMQHPELIKTVRNDTPGKPESFNVSRKHSPGKRCVSFRRVKGERHQALSFGQARTRGNVLERNAGATRIVYPHCVVASPVTAPAASFFSAPGQRVSSYTGAAQPVRSRWFGFCSERTPRHGPRPFIVANFRDVLCLLSLGDRPRQVTRSTHVHS